MATFHRTPRGSAYLDISWLELSEYSHNPIPVCDECLQDMRGLKSITLIPILNQAYCPRCATSVLRRLGRYPEDAAIKKTQRTILARLFRSGRYKRERRVTYVLSCLP